MSRWPLFLPFTLLLTTPIYASVSVSHLRCEQRTNPAGIDIATPRLGWRIETSANERGVGQSGYQVLVATSSEKLSKDQGDLWDSKRVASRESLFVPYAGESLKSGAQIFWKVRIWDQANRVSRWSNPAQWTTGLLKPSDWTAKWICGPVPATRLSLGYHAAETKAEDDVKWVQVDLGKSRPIDDIRLTPMVHQSRPGFGFPVRFKIEASDDADFTNPRLIADQTQADFANPGLTPSSFPAKDINARYIRVTATKLWRRDATTFAFALRQLEVLANRENLGRDMPVTAKDSVEAYSWGKAGLTDGVLTSAESPDASGQFATLLLRKQFQVKPGLRRATAFVTGLGQYEMTVNGQKTGNDILSPGWTNYRKTVLYDTRDITGQLKPGANAIGLLLGNGMYNVQPGRYTKFTGSFGQQKTIAQIRLEYADGSNQTLGTDESWRAASGPITFSHVYGGEDYDARLEPAGWNQPGFNAKSWIPATVCPGPGGDLKGVNFSNPPIRTFETFKPVSVRNLRPGVTLYDMGQNAAIMPKLVVHGPAGSMVRIVPGELLAPNGGVSQSDGGGPCYWQYTLAGKGKETYFPKFYYRGSRYLQLELTAAPGSTDLPAVDSIESLAVHADAPAVGQFKSSNELFNQTWNLVRWAQRSNMVSVLTDCPQRERLGWLEQDYLNGPALRYNFDLGSLFPKILNDIADSQTKNGMVPSISPEFVKFGGDGDGNPFRNSPEWGSAFILAAWQQYEYNGDLEPLRRHYDNMKRYVAYLDSRAKDSILDFGLGDWYDIGPGQPGGSKLTPIALTATAIYYEDVTTLAKAAALLGKADDVTRYQAQAAEIRTAFNAKFYNAEKGYYARNSQTGNAMPLVLGLVEPANVHSVVMALVKDVEYRGLTAGDVGYRYLLRALADNGRSDVVFAINNQSERPGYGYQLKKGATSLTEAWDANPGSSQNHFMLGQINEWFFHDLAGIKPDGPGFSKIQIKPSLSGYMDYAIATHESPYGKIVGGAVRNGSTITIYAFIPANTSATIHVPVENPDLVKEGEGQAKQAKGVQFIGKQDGCAVFRVGSGRYEFSGPEITPFEFRRRTERVQY